MFNDIILKDLNRSKALKRAVFKKTVSIDPYLKFQKSVGYFHLY